MLSVSIRAVADFDDLPEPLALAPGEMPVSEVLARLREGER
jgi:hypothetical protein